MLSGVTHKRTNPRRPAAQTPEPMTHVTTDTDLITSPTGELQAVAPEDAIGWLKNSDMELAGGLARMSPGELARLIRRVSEVVQRQEARFVGMLEIGSALGNTLHIDDLLRVIVERTTELMEAERSTLFVVDQERDELWSKVLQGNVNVEIRLKKGQGIAGWVALHGKSLNIRDAYKDARFNRSVDESTGYQTRNILCQPIRNLQGDIIGVIQVLNRHQGNFTDEDESLLSAIASQAAIAIENSRLYLSAIDRNMELIEIRDRLEHKVAELDTLYELERMIAEAATLDEMIERIASKTLGLVHGSVCVLTLHAERHDQRYTLADRGEWETEWVFDAQRIERHGRPDDLADWVSARADSLAVRRPHEPSDPQLDPALDALLTAREQELDAHIENALLVPLIFDGEHIGAWEFMNTIDVDEHDQVGFTEDDRKLISLIGSQLASSIGRRRQQEEREKQERLATIGQMLSGVLHDFKNPMTVISGYVQVLTRTDDAERRAQMAERVLKQLEQLNQMTHELLAFARGDQTILLRKVFLYKYMDEVQELLSPELESRHVALTIELDYRNEARIDPVKLKRAILNLARNAADAMPDGGTFHVRVWRDDSDPQHPQLQLDLSDTGGGIPLEIRDRLFETFVTQGKKNGTGLGLAIVKKIVDEHQGTISFTSDLGHGTTFHIRIPILSGTS